jgi:hypothetical protein
VKKWNINKALNDKVKKLRLEAKVGKETIKELWRYRGQYPLLLEKYSKEGTCPICKKEGLIITKVNRCINCVMNEKQLKKKLEKEGSQEGYCKSCGKKTLVTKEGLCSECYLTKGKGWK